ncbi:MAG: hypothetical protein HOP26_08880 [Methylotenera sp.]|nr:hypothetical protein [Methylotenera sp.]
MTKNNKSFRLVLKTLLDKSNRNEWTFYLTVSREYLPFWLNDIRSIAVLCQEDGFNLDLPRKVVNMIDIDRLRDRVLSASFSLVGRWAFNNYAQSLRQDLEVTESIAVKLTMAKMIVFQIRSIDLPRNSA